MCMTHRREGRQGRVFDIKSDLMATNVVQMGSRFTTFERQPRSAKNDAPWSQLSGHASYDLFLLVGQVNERRRRVMETSAVHPKAINFARIPHTTNMRPTGECLWLI